MNSNTLLAKDGGHWLDVHIYQTSEIEEEVATLNRVRIPHVWRRARTYYTALATIGTRGIPGTAPIDPVCPLTDGTMTML